MSAADTLADVPTRDNESREAAREAAELVKDMADRLFPAEIADSPHSEQLTGLRKVLQTTWHGTTLTAMGTMSLAKANEEQRARIDALVERVKELEDRFHSLVEKHVS